MTFSRVENVLLRAAATAVLFFARLLASMCREKEKLLYIRRWILQTNQSHSNHDNEKLFIARGRKEKQ
jgi:cell division protein FtsL